MKFRPLLGTDLSGSVGGITASHNAGGPYFRNRAIPTNPNTPFQQAVRGFMATLTSRWNNNLSVPQRAGWDLYALNVPIPDTLGEPRNIGGLAQYVRSNVPRLQTTLARVDDAPIVFNLGEFTNPTFDTFDAAAETFDVNFTEADEWVGEANAGMIVYSGRPKNATVNFFKGPYRFAATLLGSVGSPPTTPATITAAFVFGVGNNVFVNMRISRPDGRLSLPFRGFGLGA